MPLQVTIVLLKFQFAGEVNSPSLDFLQTIANLLAYEQFSLIVDTCCDKRRCLKIAKEAIERQRLFRLTRIVEKVGVIVNGKRLCQGFFYLPLVEPGV